MKKVLLLATCCMLVFFNFSTAFAQDGDNCVEAIDISADVAALLALPPGNFDAPQVISVGPFSNVGANDFGGTAITDAEFEAGSGSPLEGCFAEDRFGAVPFVNNSTWFAFTLPSAANLSIVASGQNCGGTDNIYNTDDADDTQIVVFKLSNLGDIPTTLAASCGALSGAEVEQPVGCDGVAVPICNEDYSAGTYTGLYDSFNDFYPGGIDAPFSDPGGLFVWVIMIDGFNVPPAADGEFCLDIYLNEPQINGDDQCTGTESWCATCPDCPCETDMALSLIGIDDAGDAYVATDEADLQPFCPSEYLGTNDGDLLYIGAFLSVPTCMDDGTAQNPGPIESGSFVVSVSPSDIFLPFVDPADNIWDASFFHAIGLTQDHVTAGGTIDLTYTNTNGDFGECEITYSINIDAITWPDPATECPACTEAGEITSHAAGDTFCANAGVCLTAENETPYTCASGSDTFYGWYIASTDGSFVGLIRDAAGDEALDEGGLPIDPNNDLCIFGADLFVGIFDTDGDGTAETVQALDPGTYELCALQFCEDADGNIVEDCVTCIEVTYLGEDPSCPETCNAGTLDQANAGQQLCSGTGSIVVGTNGDEDFSLDCPYDWEYAYAIFDETGSTQFTPSFVVQEPNTSFSAANFNDYTVDPNNPTPLPPGNYQICGRVFCSTPSDGTYNFCEADCINVTLVDGTGPLCTCPAVDLTNTDPITACGGAVDVSLEITGGDGSQVCNGSQGWGYLYFVQNVAADTIFSVLFTDELGGTLNSSTVTVSSSTLLIDQFDELGGGAGAALPNGTYEICGSYACIDGDALSNYGILSSCPTTNCRTITIADNPVFSDDATADCSLSIAANGAAPWGYEIYADDGNGAPTGAVLQSLAGLSGQATITNTEAAVQENGNYVLVVTDGNGCMATYTFALSCELFCAVFDGTPSLVETQVCTGSTVTTQDEGITLNDSPAGSVVWAYSNDPAFDPYTDGIAFNAGDQLFNSQCDPAVLYFKARIDGAGIDADQTCQVSSVAVSIMVYPDITVSASGSCEVTATVNCPDLVTISYSVDGGAAVAGDTYSPGPGASGSVVFSAEPTDGALAGLACLSASSEPAAFNCAVNCAVLNDDFSVAETDVCSGGAITLTGTATQNESPAADVVWYIGESAGFDVDTDGAVYANGALTNADPCNTKTYYLKARLENADIAGNACTGMSGEFSVNVHAAPTASIEAQDACTVSIMEACGFDVTWDDGTNTGAGSSYTLTPDLTDQTGTVTFTVSNSNAPADCSSFSIEVPYNCVAVTCPALDGVAVAETAMCDGGSVTLSGTATAGTLTWVSSESSVDFDAYTEGTPFDGSVSNATCVAKEIYIKARIDGVEAPCPNVSSDAFTVTVYPQVAISVSENNECTVTATPSCPNFDVTWDDGTNTGSGTTYTTSAGIEDVSGSVTFTATQAGAPDGCSSASGSGDFLCPGTPCPALDGNQGVSETAICSGGTAAVVEGGISNDDGTGTIAWYYGDTDGFDPATGTAYEGSLPEASGCSPTAYYIVAVLEGINPDCPASVSAYFQVDVYPSITATATDGIKGDDGCTAATVTNDCGYSVSWIADDPDIDGNSTGSGMMYNPATGSIGSVTFTLTNDAAPLDCFQASFSATYNCSEDVCSALDGAQAVGSTAICNGDVIALTDGAVVDNDFSGGFVSWSYDTDESFDPYVAGTDFDASTGIENAGCDPITVYVKARLDGVDGCQEETAAAAVTVYPTVDFGDADLVVDLDACTVTLATACDYPVTWVDNTGTEGEGSNYVSGAGSEGFVTFSYDNGDAPDACNFATASAQFACTVDQCASLDGTQAVEESAVCSGTAVTLVDGAINDGTADVSGSSITWVYSTSSAEFDAYLEGTAFDGNLPENTTCAAVTYFIKARLDGVSLNGEACSSSSAATEVSVFPVPAVEVTGDACDGGLTITSACADLDVQWSDSIQGDGSGDFSANAGDEGSVSFTVAVMGAPEGCSVALDAVNYACVDGPSCNDGMMNGDETGVDCGGSCDACPTCDDGMMNGDETGVDCGGSCDACPTCDDGMMNGDETGVDCGGSCDACPTCDDGIQNGDETDVDCGGSCDACYECPSLDDTQSISGNAVCSGGSVSLNDGGITGDATGASISWVYADGSPFDGTLPAAEGCNAATYMVKAVLSVDGQNCADESDEMMITVYPDVTISISEEGACNVAVNACEGYDVTFETDGGETGAGTIYSAGIGTSGSVTFTVMNPAGLEGCNMATVTGSFECTDPCTLNSAGSCTLSLYDEAGRLAAGVGPENVCPDQGVQASVTNAVIQDGFSGTFIMYTDPADPTGSQIASDDAGLFINDGSLPQDQALYVAYYITGPDGCEKLGNPDNTSFASSCVPDNNPPQACNDNQVIPAADMYDFNVLGSDCSTDPDGDPITVISVNGNTDSPFSTTEGDWTFDESGNITFDPADGFAGTVTVEYVITDGQAEATGSLTIVVEEVQGVVLGLNCAVEFDGPNNQFSVYIDPSLGDGSYTVMTSAGDAGTATEGVVSKLGPFDFADYSGSDFMVTITDASGNTGSCSKFIETTLAVELVDFYGEAQATGNALTWVTASEENNDFFTLYRSYDGANFEAIATIDGENTNTVNTYNHLDKDVNGQTAYYMLQQTDFDGTTSNSNVITIHRETAPKGLILVSPVPATDIVNVEFMTNKSSKITINVYDVTGKLIDAKVANTTTGYNNITLDVTRYNVGVYFMSITDGNEVYTARIIKD